MRMSMLFCERMSTIFRKALDLSTVKWPVMGQSFRCDTDQARLASLIRDTKADIESGWQMLTSTWVSSRKSVHTLAVLDIAVYPMSIQMPMLADKSMPRYQHGICSLID